MVIVCGPPDFLDEHEDTLLNPTVIVEVLSDSTEAYDRGEKSERYRACPSLREYVVVSQNEPLVERYEPSPDGEWVRTEYRGLNAVVRFESIGVKISLLEIYRRAFDDA